MESRLEKRQSKSDHDIVDSDNEFHTPLRLKNNFEQGASKKKNFSFIDIKSSLVLPEKDSELLTKMEMDRKSSRSKTEITLPEKPSTDKKCEKKNTFSYEKKETGENEEKNLMSIKKDYEKKIVSRDLDQSLLEISNIKIISNTVSCTNCNITFLDETLNLSEKMPPFLAEIRFPNEKPFKIEIQNENILQAESQKDNEKEETPSVSTKTKNKTSENMTSSQTNTISLQKKPSKKNSLIAINDHAFRNLIFSPTVSELVFKAHLLNTYKGLIYAKRFLKPPPPQFLREKMVTLPEIKAPKYKTLFLDLDETLIHTCPASSEPDHLIKGNDEKGNEIIIGLNMRPLCHEFLKKISQYYEIFIFTAATINYANAVVNFLDPLGQFINGVLCRTNCLITKNGMFIKDLRIIKNRELKNMVLIDNLAHSFGLQIENGIPILEFQNDKKDRELKYLFDYLMQALYVDDLRVFNRKNLRLNQLATFKLEDLLKFE